MRDHSIPGIRLHLGFFGPSSEDREATNVRPRLDTVPVEQDVDLDVRDAAHLGAKRFGGRICVSTDNS